MSTLRFLCIYILILHCHGQPVFDCPLPVGYGDSANLTCSKLNQRSGNIRNPASEQLAVCLGDSCRKFQERINASMVIDLILLTVHKVYETDEGEWSCESGTVEARCSLFIYKLPSCVISSTTSTSNLTIGQDVPLKISLFDYYCTNSITWNLQIRGKPQNITEFREREETENITDRIVTYSPKVTSSLTGRVKLTFNCNDEKYNVNCSGVEELKLREPPSCNLTSVKDTQDLTIGSNLTLEAAIEEYPCTSGIKYALLTGSLMVTEFIRRDSLFYATFEVKPVYLNNQLHLQYTCNNVSATTRTRGVEMLFKKEGPLKQSINLVTVIGLLVGIIVIVIAVLFGILIYRNRRHHGSPSNEVSVYNIPSTYNDNEERYQELIPVVKPHQVQDVDYLTPQAPQDTQNLPNVDYEIIEDTEQVELADRQIRTNIHPDENKDHEYVNTIEVK